MSEFRIGDIIEGEITGIQKYGVFVKLSPEEQGLVHISECRHGYIVNFNDYYKIGDLVKVMIVDIDEYTDKISLSMRSLTKLNTPPFPARNKRLKKRYTPAIGFQSLADQMPLWIEEAMHNIDIEKYKKRKKDTLNDSH